ncbi:NAD(P)H-dependent oxidoreductase [Amycolatopsis rubida]|uniref:NAD(P)H-dependent oxidoreductase n=1 Tax=Amycolatopsis rubida TaxID=112413 RepID=A0ABX0C0Z7_9PSEU|nr:MULTISPECIES: NAD(P)H-dependent oxidoreductase [Amycolatopsis]MYW95451.1 FMN reductase [Amycolatopsis rubida]NEC60440.1 NAD(P)H-dependent oxidoreductase [Amycolatopsis rubida]OAP21406.1 FMN-dependent NADPH-azoreductase [Amycolatopsis sp. M39]
MHTVQEPTIVGVGGTVRPDSSSERALRAVLENVRAHGARTELFTARDLGFAMYEPDLAHRCPSATAFLDAVRRADGVLISTPGYHGGLSGLLKNALDYLQDLAGDDRPYLHGRAVGCIVSAYGPQAGVTTLTSLRSTVHALRGWPTPLGVVVDSTAQPFAADGRVADRKLAAQLATVAEQVARFATAEIRTVA